jgi:hypothetical protein
VHLGEEAACFGGLTMGEYLAKCFAGHFIFFGHSSFPLSLVSKRNKRHTKREKWSTTKISLLLKFFVFCFLREDYVGVSH